MIAAYWGVTNGGRGFVWFPDEFTAYYETHIDEESGEDFFEMGARFIRRKKPQRVTSLLSKLRGSGWVVNTHLFENQILDNYHKTLDEDGQGTRDTAFFIHGVFSCFMDKLDCLMDSYKTGNYSDIEDRRYDDNENIPEEEEWWQKGGRPPLEE